MKFEIIITTIFVFIGALSAKASETVLSEKIALEFVANKQNTSKDDIRRLDYEDKATGAHIAILYSDLNCGIGTCTRYIFSIISKGLLRAHGTIEGRVVAVDFGKSKLPTVRTILSAGHGNVEEVTWIANPKSQNYEVQN